MLSDISFWFTASFIVLTFALIIVIVIGVLSVLNRAGTKNPRLIAVLTIVGLLVWVLGTGFLGWAGFYREWSAMPPRFMIAGFLPFLLTTIILLTRESVGELLRHTPVFWLIGVQAFRIGVELCLYQLYQYGAIPQILTFEGRNMDMLVGLSAPMVAFAYNRGWLSIQRLILWNVVSFIILSVVVVNGVFSAPTPFQLIMTNPVNIGLGYFPYIWVVTFLAPVALLFHCLSLKQLYARLKDTRQETAQ